MCYFRKGFFIISCIFILFIAGCDEISKSQDDNTQINKEPIIINEVSIPLVNFNTLNPLISKDESVYYLSKLIYESLINLDESLGAKPLLAKSWEYLNDGYELVFHLRENVMWHNENAFTADDVVFTIETLLNNKNDPESLYKKYITNIKSVTKIDTYTVKINFYNNYDNSIERFVFPILSKQYIASLGGNIYKKTSNYKPIGTGPYTVAEIEKLKYIKLVKNDHYWGDKPINNLIFKIVPSPEEAIGLLEISDINIAYSFDQDWEKYLEDKTISIYDFVSNEPEIIGFNFDHDLLSDRRIRQAIAYAIDTDEIINHIYLGAGTKSNSIYYPNYLGENSLTHMYLYNEEKAKTLLQEAGFINRDDDPIYENINGKELTLNILVNSENKTRVDSAKIIKKSLDKVGISTNIIYVGFDDYTELINKGQYDLFLGGWRISSLMDFRFALHSEYNNPINYSNDYLDYLLVELQRNKTVAEKKVVYNDILKILDQEIPYYCILYKKHGAIASNDLTGDIDPSFFNYYNEANSWQIVKKP